MIFKNLIFYYYKMNLIKTFFLFFSVVNSQLLGANNDPSGNGCVTDGGYEWCKETKSCVRSWETAFNNHITDTTAGQRHK